jgi:hypothetical protein
VEAGLLVALLWLYRLGRYLGRDQVDEAFRHAHEVLRWERPIGFLRERNVQDLVLHHHGVVRVLNRYYAMVHFPATGAFLAVVYIRAPELYRKVRLQFVSVTAIALLVQIAWPLAPPRMMSGFVDTIARFGPAIYSRPEVAKLANQYAAMPSLHVGWALLIAYGCLHLTRRWWRWVGVAHAAMTTFAVVATANHYWADAVAAALLVVAATWIAHRWVTRHPARPAAPADELSASA